MKASISKISLGTLAAAALIVALFAAVPTVHAQETAPDPTIPRTITVVGEGTVSIRPDLAQANIGVEVVKPTVQEASTEAQKVMEAVLAALQTAGVDEKDIQTAGFSISAERYGPEGPRSDEDVRYTVRNNVSVVIRELDNVGSVLDAAIAAGANNTYGVNFRVADPSPLESEARSLAVADAQAKAQELAQLNGVTVGEVVRVSEVIGSGGGALSNNFANKALSSGAGPIAPGELTFTTQLEITYAMGAGDSVRAAEPEAAASTVTEKGVTESVTVTSAVSEGTAPVTVTIVGGDEASLRRFLKNLVAPRYPGMPATDITVFVASLPDQMAIDLTVPDEMDVIGSQVTQNDGRNSQILLETELPAADALAAIRQQLEAQGLTQPEAQREAPGQVFASPSREDILLCDETGDLYVNLFAGAGDEATTGLRIQISEDTPYGSPCDSTQFKTEGEIDVLPELSAPENTRVQASGSSRGPDRVEVNADLQSDLSLDTLAQHYHNQLETAGWQQLDTSLTDAIAWSAWSFNDEAGNEWTATFLITRGAGETDQYRATLSAQRQR